MFTRLLQTATRWDLLPYRITIWVIDWWCNVYLFTWWIDTRFLLQRFDIGNRWNWTCIDYHHCSTSVPTNQVCIFLYIKILYNRDFVDDNTFKNAIHTYQNQLSLLRKIWLLSYYDSNLIISKKTQLIYVFRSRGQNAQVLYTLYQWHLYSFSQTVSNKLTFRGHVENICKSAFILPNFAKFLSHQQSKALKNSHFNYFNVDVHVSIISPQYTI